MTTIAEVVEALSGCDFSAFPGLYDAIPWTRLEAAAQGADQTASPPAAEIVAGMEEALGGPQATPERVTAVEDRLAAAEPVPAFLHPNGQAREPNAGRPCDERARDLAVIKDEALKIEHGCNVESMARTLASLIAGLVRVVEELN